MNRFSKDVEFLDDLLVMISIEYLTVSPRYLIFYSRNLFKVLTRFFAAIITASIANPYILVVVAVLFLFSLLFRWYYLKTARDIKRLEALGQLLITQLF